MSVSKRTRVPAERPITQEKPLIYREHRDKLGMFPGTELARQPDVLRPVFAALKHEVLRQFRADQAIRFFIMGGFKAVVQTEAQVIKRLPTLPKEGERRATEPLAGSCGLRAPGGTRFAGFSRFFWLMWWHGKPEDFPGELDDFLATQDMLPIVTLEWAYLRHLAMDGWEVELFPACLPDDDDD